MELRVHHRLELPVFHDAWRHLGSKLGHRTVKTRMPLRGVEWQDHAVYPSHLLRARHHLVMRG